MEKKYFMILIIASLIYMSYVYVKPMTHSKTNKYIILMAGRSTMMLWFKHWNWPYPLRIKTTYRNWPIKYNEYAKGKLFLEYLELPGPVSANKDMSFGDSMIESVRKKIEKDYYNGIFFKFCFVDFIIEEEHFEQRLNEMKKTIKKIFEIANKKHITLIIGNALPLPDPNFWTLKLEKEFNAWLAEFSKNEKNLLIFDLFGPLTDTDGRMNMKLARAPYDHHPSDKAFDVLDKFFFPIVESFISESITKK